MSIKTWLTPIVTSRMFSPEALQKQREKAERKRIREGRPHVVEYFHQIDDPYSALMSQVLKKLVENYDIQLVCHLVPQPDPAAAPEMEKLRNHSMRDARLLAQRHGFGTDCFIKQPDQPHLTKAARILGLALQRGKFAETAATVSESLWCAEPDISALDNGPQCSIADLQNQLNKGKARREELGHYLGATLWYEGEWYWGPDRLHHLERRLLELGAAKNSPKPVFEVLGDGQPGRKAGSDQSIQAKELDFFFSIRSPYSAIVTPRVFELARETGAEINYKFVLPMVMRGLPVPKDKRQYIVRDTAREAHWRGVPFGRMNDPVGKPTERVLSIIPLAQTKGLAQQWLATAMDGIWARGTDAGSDDGLRRLVEKAGLNWQDAQAAVADDQWRKQAELHREELFDHGLWGVPSFKVGNKTFWGQDRLWAVRQALEENTP